MKVEGYPTTTSGGARSFFVTLRPWRELIAHPSSYYTRPLTFTEFTGRLKRNFNYFRVNYVIMILLIIFLSLLWHPVSMIVFLIVFVLWFFLYLSRDEPLVVFNQMVDDRIVLVLLSVVTIVGLVLTGVWVNVLVSVSVGVLLVVVHAGFRVTEDLFVEIDDDADGGGGGLLSFVSSSNPSRSGYGGA